MAEHYWVVRVQGGAVEGPFAREQIGEMAALGEITASSVISTGGEWRPVSSFEGLLPRPVRVASVVPIAPPIVPGPLGHLGRPGESRRLGWFVVLGAVLCGLTLLSNVIFFAAGAQQGFAPDDPFGFNRPPAPPTPAEAIGGAIACVGILAAIALWIYWLVWVYSVHREIAEFMGRAHPISPGLAIGLCFVPLFNMFWAPYITYRLARTVDDLTAPARVLSPATALVFMILAQVPGCCLWPGLTWLLTALGTRHVQNGLNQLWLRSGPAAAPA